MGTHIQSLHSILVAFRVPVQSVFSTYAMYVMLTCVHSMSTFTLSTLFRKADAF